MVDLFSRIQHLLNNNRRPKVFVDMQKKLTFEIFGQNCTSVVSQKIFCFAEESPIRRTNAMSEMNTLRCWAEASKQPIRSQGRENT